MPQRSRSALLNGLSALTLCLAGTVNAAPEVTRLTPPSELFSSQRDAPVIARFLPGQRFDLQATIRPDGAQTLVSATFAIDGRPLASPVSLLSCASACAPGLPANAGVATLRAFSLEQAGIHRFTVSARQSDGQVVTASGNFEIVPFSKTHGPPVKNIVILLGDGMGAGHRTAARIMAGGYAQGKVARTLEIDRFPFSALVKTASLSSIVTDSSAGMAAYTTGNKNANFSVGVFPDDTLDPFDNPRIELLSEYLHRTQGKALGLVTNADLFDATPAGNAVHGSNRHAGSGIVDQYLDDRHLTGLTVLLGGGRKWFVPAGQPGSARTAALDYRFDAQNPHTALLMQGWGAAAGQLDASRDLIADFRQAGFGFAENKTGLDRIDPRQTPRLLGLFAWSSMNSALDKINGRRARAQNTPGRTVVGDHGLPDQPMLDEMTAKALEILARQPRGFVLMVEGASIDKQAHMMDAERWLWEMQEFDRTVGRVRQWAQARGDTLVIVTADHDTGGAAAIGARLPSAQTPQPGAPAVRDETVGLYDRAGFPHYTMAADGYPQDSHIDRQLLIGYASNADRYEDWQGKPLPLRDSHQPFASRPPLSSYPTMDERSADTGFRITGQVPGKVAAHTGTDVPLSAAGPGAWMFSGVLDNTDVFFRLAQAAVKGPAAPGGAW